MQVEGRTVHPPPPEGSLQCLTDSCYRMPNQELSSSLLLPLVPNKIPLGSYVDSVETNHNKEEQCQIFKWLTAFPTWPQNPIQAAEA